jgi:hypothetical protein
MSFSFKFSVGHPPSLIDFSQPSLYSKFRCPGVEDFADSDATVSALFIAFNPTFWK